MLLLFAMVYVAWFSTRSCCDGGHNADLLQMLADLNIKKFDLEALEDAITSLIYTLPTYEAEAIQALTQIQTDVKSVQDTIDVMQLSITSMQSSIASGQSSIQSLRTDVDSTSAGLQTVTTKTTDNASAIKQMQTTVSSLSPQIDSLNGDINDIVNEMCHYWKDDWSDSFTLFDPSTCKLKAKVKDCPRGIYGTNCKSKMCPGGTNVTGNNYNYDSATTWCKDNHGPKYKCDATVGLCAKTS